MIIQINPTNPEPEKIDQVVTSLTAGGLIVYPTDTIYGLGCDIFNKDAVKKIYQFKKREAKKPLSIICADIKDIAKYAIIPEVAFRLLKKTLPGPFTYILKANNKVPDTFIAKNKTVGVRIPDNEICLALVKSFGTPIITTSLNLSDEEVMTSPLQMPLELRNKIDIIIDAGYLPQEPSTIIDLTKGEPIIVRQGKGDISQYL